MNLRIITKNHAADSKIGSPLKIDFRADWSHESNPTAWELSYKKVRFVSESSHCDREICDLGVNPGRCHRAAEN